jgi:subtilisin family serine protease
MKYSSWLPLFALAMTACSGEGAGDPTLPPSPDSETAAAAPETYVVLYRAKAVPRDALQVIAAAGGTVAKAYPELGVVLARSSNPSFSEMMSADASVEAVSATSLSVTKVNLDRDDTQKIGTKTSALTADTAGDPLSPFQWDMNQIHAPEAHEITGGSASVVSGVMDSGIDRTHPDVATQIDYASSVSCVTGVPNTDPEVWGTDFFGHGTFVSSLIAAPENGVGIVGVAPGTRVAMIQVVTDTGLIFPEAFVCGLTWAADHGLPVVNASLFVDPWYFACKNDPAQRAVWKAIQRAVNYAMSKGTTLIAAASNTADDLDHPTVDFLSPTDGVPETREINNACSVLPVEVGGVVGVSAVGATQQLAFYSNYGLEAIDVTAPGGDLFVITPEAENGQLLGALPPDSLFYMFARDFFGTAKDDCSSGTCITYAGLQGTSMAAPHATGVAALAISQHGAMSPADLLTFLQDTATPLACPEGSTTCSGQPGSNNFYGAGEVDALAAVQ